MKLGIEFKGWISLKKANVIRCIMGGKEVFAFEQGDAISLADENGRELEVMPTQEFTSRIEKGMMSIPLDEMCRLATKSDDAEFYDKEFATL